MRPPYLEVERRGLVRQRAQVPGGPSIGGGVYVVVGLRVYCGSSRPIARVPPRQPKLNKTTHPPEVAGLDVVHPGQARRGGLVGALGEELLQLALGRRRRAAVLEHVVELVAVWGGGRGGVAWDSEINMAGTYEPLSSSSNDDDST